MTRVHRALQIVNGIFFETLFGLGLVVWTLVLCVAAYVLYR